MEAITLERITKTYKSFATVQAQALTDISLVAQKGEFVVLAGPSGSGKTTLLNIMGTLDQPDSGRVFIFGQDVTGLTRNELADLRLRKIGFVFQAYNLINVLTAVENVEYVLLLQGMAASERKAKALKILNEVGLKDFIHRRPYQMSGGQQQRVAVARAIAAEPDIILADEPTANLDSKTGLLLIELLKKFNEDKGVTFIISSHDPMVIERAKRVIKIKDGRIAEMVSQS
jgi:putative ABC transport system ATP-binding protein